MIDHRALASDLRKAVKGDVWFDRLTRAVFASDASNYRQVPLGVVRPVDAHDLAAAMRVCADHDVGVHARGAGTSLAGQAVNAGVVMDTSRYLTSIRSIDPERRTAVVEPGVILDDLRRAAAPFGLTFGPDPATHAWCTVGGMIGNDACGTHALVAGRTSENVEALTVVTYGGSMLSVGARGQVRPVSQAAESDARRIRGQLSDLVRSSEGAIRTGYPSLRRRVSGYGLDWLLDDREVHVARALVGTESTCVVIVEAELRLVALPPTRRLVVIAYDDVFAAADDVPNILEHEPIALEGFDSALVDLMRVHRLNADHLGLLPPAGAWLYAEIGGANDQDADAGVARLTASLPAETVWVAHSDPNVQDRLWAIRESGLGATAIRPDGGHNLEGWEDAAVPPAQLGRYLRSLTALWAEFGYSGAWYGHFGEGCVHTRNDFDFSSRDGLARYRDYVERAADLVVSLGGSISGEHGDGQARGELLSRMYGPDLIEAFRSFKRIWDPRGRMNPGKVIDAAPLDSNLRFGPDHYAAPSALTAEPSAFALPSDRGSLKLAAERCVGIGRCRGSDSGVMCPSYRVTRDERHSTRGRAKVLTELFVGDVTPSTWQNDDVKSALDLCLSCKGCVVDCPTGVDMATYKAEFMSRYYRRRLRPRSAYALGLIPLWTRLASRSPRLVNSMLQARGLGSLARRAAGITPDRPLPRLTSTPWRRTPMARSRLDRDDATVVVWPDTFTNAFTPAHGDDIVTILEGIGERVALPAGWGCCGRTLFDYGFLDLAKAWMRDLVTVLEPWAARGIPIIVPEPSCLAAFRDELPSLLPGDPRVVRVSSAARSLSELLLDTDRLERLVANMPTGPEKAAIHPHCHARASGATTADAEVMRRLGYDTAIIDAGCCGLAGSFGFRADTESVSRRIGLDEWLPKVEASTGSDARLIADGFSCQTQLAHLSSIPSETMAGFLRRGHFADR